MPYTADDIRRMRKERANRDSVRDSYSSSTKTYTADDIKAMRAARNAYNIPTTQSVYNIQNASVASTQPSIEPKQEYRYNSIAEYDKALEEAKNDKASFGKNVVNMARNVAMALPGYKEDKISQDFYNKHFAYTDAEREYEALLKERNLYKNEHILEEMQNKYTNNADFADLSRDLSPEEIRSLGSAQDAQLYTHNTSKMSPDEKAIANYVYRKEGKKGLNKFYDEIMPSVDKRNYEETLEKQREWVNEEYNGPVADNHLGYLMNSKFMKNSEVSLATIPANMIGGAGAIGEAVSSTLEGRDYNPYGGLQKLASYAEDTREDVSKNITDATGSEKVLPFLYQTGMSVLDSTAGAMAMGNAYSVIMGGTAFNSTYRDIEERGGSREEAITTAAIAGIAEAFFEKYSLDNVLDPKDVTNFPMWIKETLKQGGIEASEEVATEIANIIADGLVNGVNSDLQIKIDELRDQGYSEAEISSMVAKDLAMQIGEAGLGGLVSGLMMGGTFNSLQYHQLSNMGDYVDRNKLSGIDFSDNENAQSLSKKYGDEWASKAKSAEIGATYREQHSKSEKGLEKAELDSATDAIAKTYNISQSEAAELADAVLTDKDNRTLKQNRLLNTRFGSAIEDDYNNKEGWYGFDENGRLKNDFSKASNAFEQYSKVVNARKSDAQVSAEKASKALKVGQTNLVNGEEADIISMSQNKDGSYTVKTSKGNYKASDVTVDERTATALSWSANIANEALKEAYVKNFSGGDINDYDMYARFLFEWGKMGADWSMYYDNVTSVMPKDKAEQLYNAGMEFDKKDLKFTQAAFDIAVAEMKSSKTKKGDFEGGKFENGSFVKDDDFYRNLSRTKKRLYLICKAFADFAGINVQVINDEDVASENGHFVVDRPDGGTVMINLAARPYSDSAYGMHSYVIDTLSHELTHWMRANNEEGYKILEKAISDHLKSKGVYDDLIKNEIESHKKAHPGEKELDEFDALEEVIARGCEDMLEDSKTMREVLSTLDVNSLEKLRIAFDKWFDRVETFLDKLMSGFESPNEVIKYLRDEYKTFRKLWVEGIQGAIKNAQTQTTDVRSQQMNADKLTIELLEKEKASIEKATIKISKQIDDWYQGIMPQGRYFAFGTTPYILQVNGMQKLPITMNEDGILKFTTDYKDHSISTDSMKEFPKEMARPLMVFVGSKPNSIVEIINEEDKKLEKIVIAIHLNDKQNRLTVNRIASAYGKESTVNYALYQIEKGNLLDIDKKRSLDWFTSEGVPFSKLVQTNINASKDTIAQMDAIYKKNSDKLSVKQEITSEDTSLNQTPATFTNFRFRSTDRILDYGGGRYDTAKRAMEQMYPGIKFEVVDEFNRTSEHNKRILDEYSKDKADVLTVNNVLNVIKEADIREDVIRESKRYLKSNGTAYFAIYEGNGSAEGGETSKGWQNNAKAEWYVPAIDKYYKNVKRVGSFILASDGEINYSRLDSDGKAQIQDYTKSLKGENLDMKQVKYSTKLADERQQNSLNKVVNKVGIEVQDSYAYPKYSDKTWRASEYVTNKTAAIKALAKSMDITEKEAEQYINDIGSIANQIANDPDRLDYISIEGKSAWVSNPEYGGYLDYSFLCPKRLTYTGTMNAILAKQNDLIFSVDDFLFLRRALISAGYEAPCSFCFVESARARFGKYNQQFLDLAKEEKLAYIPTAEELSNPDKLEEMRSAHPETFKRYEKFLNSLSQRKPKMLEERRPYNGDILKAFQGKEHTIIEKNLHGGIRFNSFSDFETVHMIDCMQAIMDMSRVGLAGFGYTKQKAFAEIFGKTGLKIDMSCVAKGVTQDGKHIIFDDIEGMNHKDALKLRNGNVGIVCVVFTDDQIRAALCDERIDYVLPFHRSQWSKKDYEKMGLSLDTKDFTRLQTEKFGTKKAKEGNIPFLSYWNENQTGEETVQRYLDIINEQNKTPIFPFILEKDEKGNWIMPKGKRDHNGKLLNKKEEIKELAAKNYWKLLTEYKMYDNDGTPIGQYPVKPIFDMDAAHKLLKKYDGSHKEFPVSNEVVEDFINYKKTGESKLLPEWKKYSDKLDTATFKGKKFWSGSVSLTDGTIEEVHTYEEAEIAGFHHTFYFSEAQVEKMDDDENAFFFINNGRVEIWRDEIPDWIIGRIEDQIKLPRKYSDKLDSTYMEAVESGNLTLAQQMVDQAAKEAGYTIKGYHGTEDYGFKVFDPNKSDDHISLFFSTNKGMANTYVGDKSKIYETYLKITNPYIVDAHGSMPFEIYLDEDLNTLPKEVRAIYEYGIYFQNNIDSAVDYTYVLENPGEAEESARYLIEAAEENGSPYSEKEKAELIRLAQRADEAFESWDESKYLDKDGEPQSLEDYVWEHKIDKTSTRKLAKYAKDNGYDGLIVKNIKDNGKHYREIGEMYESDVIVVFDSNQVKSADAVTYDDNGNIIPLSERFDLNQKDIRYSDKLDSTGKELSKGQQNYFIKSKVRDAQGRLLVVYHGTYEDFDIFKPNSFIKEINGISRIVGYFSEDRSYSENYGDVTPYYLNIENPLVLDGTEKTLDEWRAFLEANGITDVIFDSSVTGENGQIDTLKGGTYPDGTKYIFYELLDMSNYWYGDGNLTERIQAAGYDGIQSNDYEKAWMPFNQDAPKRIDNLNPTHNESTRKSEKLDLTNASPEVKERVKELEKQVGKLTKENDALKAAKAMAAEKAQKEALANKITEQSKTLSKWLLTDPKANPVPQPLRKPIINLLRSIDYTTSSFAWRKAHEFEYTKKDQSMAVMMGRLNHMLNEINQDEVNDSEAYDLSQLDWLPAFTKEFDQITNAINEAEKTSGERFVLQQMSVEDLEKLNKLITALKTSVHNMNKVFGEHNKESVSDLGKEMITYLDEIGQKNVDNALTQFLEMDNTTPYYFFKRLGPAGQKLFKILMDAQGNYAFKAKEIETYAKSVFKGKDVNKWREQIKEFDITEVKYGGKEVAEPEKTHIKMTVPQIMSLYCLSKRDQALKHLSSGGMKISTFKEGKNDVRQLDNVTLSEKDLNMIISTLTDEQREVADKLQEFLTTTCSAWGNEVTMQRFGYKAYTEKNYFPIVVDTNVLNKEPRQKGSSLYQLLNMGFTKPLNPKAKNPIEIFDIFEVFTTHATDMAQYNTFALPILNVIRVWNYKEVETLETADEDEWSTTKENTERDTGEADEIERQKYITVKASIEKTIGAKGNRYIGRLLADLNGDITGGRADRLDKFSKNYKTAAVAANVQVALLQPLSYIRADYVIDAKYLAKAVGMKSDPELIKKYCGMAVWKSMGFYNLAINNGLAHMIMQDDSTKDRIIEKTLWLAGKMDELTWQKLWNACELEVKDKTNLKGEEYYKAVGERLTDVIFATQVVDSVLTKSELMRGTDTYTKMLTAFNAEPTLGLNILMDAAEMFDQERRAHGTQSALRKHGATMKKAAAVYLLGSLAESVLRAVWGRIRNYDGEDDDETLIHEIVTRFLEELNPLRKIPFVKDLYGILVQTISVFAGDQYKIYADTRMDEASIEALANAIVQVPKVIKKQEITYKDINKIAKGVDASGLPVSSTIRIFKGIWNNTIGRIWESALIK